MVNLHVRVLAVEGFDSDGIRGAILEEHDAMPVIPDRRNRTDPWPWDEVMEETYEQGNRVERAFGKTKQFRAGSSSRGEANSRRTGRGGKPRT